MNKSERTKASWHLWLVGAVAILFNGMGAFDYVMTQTQNEEYLKSTAGFTQEQIDFFATLPAWSDAMWAIGVWGGILGGILLLLRKSLSVLVLLCSFIGATISLSYFYIFSNGEDVVGDPGNVAFALFIVILAYGFLHYARSMKQKGVLG